MIATSFFQSHRRPAGRAGSGPAATAFTLPEIVLIVVVMGALAAVVVPQFAGASDDARTTETESIVAGVRNAMNVYYRRLDERGEPAYPSLPELATPGVVTAQQIPANPFTGARGIQPVTREQAASRAVFNTGAAGWNYFVDNTASPPVALFYPNSAQPTTAPDAQGEPLPANHL